MTDLANSEERRPLWAPWRVEYIRSPKSGRCFICELAAGEDEGDLVVARYATCLVLLNAFPYNSGHILVAPLDHIGDLDEVPPDTLSEMMSVLIHAKKVLTHLMRPDGFNVGFNLGAAAGAGVRDHVHGHLVPRWVGDTNFMPVLSDTRVIPESLKETARLLREAW